MNQLPVIFSTHFYIGEPHHKTRISFTNSLKYFGVQTDLNSWQV